MKGNESAFFAEDFLNKLDELVTNAGFLFVFEMFNKPNYGSMFSNVILAILIPKRGYHLQLYGECQ